MTMPLFSGIWAEILWSLVSLVYGIRVEKYYVSYWSAVVNLASFFMILATVDLPLEAYAVLLAYSLFCFLVVKYDVTTLFLLLGSKTYGSLALAIGLDALTVLDWSGMQLGNRVNRWFATEAGKIILGWIVLAIASHALGYFLAQQGNGEEPIR
jgi:uncharacterized membrane protein YGL010W